MTRLLKDPLLHFVAVGAAVFAFFSLVGEDPEAFGRRIVVTEQEMAAVAQTMSAVSGRAPSEAVLLQLVEPRIREEVLYREALAMGLDRDDSQVRQRLVEKMTFLSEDLHAAAPPDEAEIAAFHAANSERFEEPATRSFEQVYFSPSEHGAGLMAAAEAGLERLRSGEPPATVGDSGTLERRFDARTAEALRGELGEDFANAVFELERDGAWHGPLRSFLGAHLVRIVASTPPRQPPLAEIRDRVAAAVGEDRRLRANEAAYRELRARYDIVIEIPEELRRAWQSDPGVE